MVFRSGYPGPLCGTWVPSVSGGPVHGSTADQAVTPVVDFDGDGTSDRSCVSAFRWAARWYVDGQATTFLGLAGDVPVPGDYDADGMTDQAVFRDGAWSIEGQVTAVLGCCG